MLIQSKPSYDSWSYRLLFVSFFMPMHLQTLVLLSLSGFWILSFQPIPAKIQRSDWGLLLLMAVSFLLYVIYIPVTEPTLRDGLYCMLERKVSLLLLPVLMLLISRRSGASVLRELPWFVYANLLSGLLVNGLLLFKYLRFDRLGSVNHVAYRMDFEQWMNIHPSYYGLFCCWSLCILLFHPAAIFRRIRIGSQALLLLFLLLLAPKTSLLTAVLIYLFTLWFYRRRLGWKMQVSLFLTSILAAGLSYLCLPFFQQRINEVLSFAGLMQTPGMSNSMDYRSLIIDIDLRLLREHWLFGLGPIGLQQVQH